MYRRRPGLILGFHGCDESPKDLCLVFPFNRNTLHQKDSICILSSEMNTALIHPSNTSSAAPVLTKAVVRAAQRLGLSQVTVSQVLGLSASTVNRMVAGTYELQANRKEWELALLFVRVFRSLDSIVGNERTAKAWLDSQNAALGGRPLDLITQTEGLVRVVHYLDISRGRL